MSDIKSQRSKRFAQLIGYELKANFARKGTSQAEVAEKLGHSKSGYSRWINAKPSMPLETFVNTCELIDVDPRDVINASYTRLIDELGDPSSVAQTLSTPTDNVSDDSVPLTADGEVDYAKLADNIAAHPDLYNLAANQDDNKELESQTPRD